MIEPAYVYRARCVRVIDADTFVMAVDLGFYVSATVPCRLQGIDAPELSTDEGQVARDFTAALLRPTPYPEANPPVILQSYRGRRSFERWVVDLWLAGQPFADILRAAGHEKPQPHV